MEIPGGAQILDESLQDFMGWLPEEQRSAKSRSWQGVKQLPTQRPRAPIMVKFRERHG